MSLKPTSTLPLHIGPLALAIAAALGGGPLVVAAAPTQATTITAVQISFDALPDPGGDFMTIMGTNFNNGGAPAVTLGTSPTQLPVFSQSATQIQVKCPVDAFTTVPTCPVGDFLLKVTTGPGTNRTATYDLTIGAVGPKGDTGATGTAGPTGKFSTAGVHQVVGPTINVPPDGAVHCTRAECPAGEVAVSGGNAIARTTLTSSGPSLIVPGARPGNWQVCARADAGTTDTLVPVAVCAP